MKNNHGHRRIQWTDEQLDYMRKHFPTEPAGDISDLLGCSSATLGNQARKLGLQKSPDVRKSDYTNRYVRRGGVIRKGE